MTYKKYLKERLDFDNEEDLETSYIDVPEIEDLSDPTGIEDFLDSNASILYKYSKGKDTKVQDNQRIYEVIKVVKSIVDKHRFLNSVQFKIRNKTNSVDFKFTLVDDQSQANSMFMEGLLQHVIMQINNRLGDGFKISHETKTNIEGYDVLILNVATRENRRDEMGDVNNISGTF